MMFNTIPQNFLDEEKYKLTSKFWKLGAIFNGFFAYTNKDLYTN